MKNDNRIEINLGNGLKLVAERNTDSNYDREIFIGLEHNGVWKQDLALVRPEYTYDHSDDAEYGDIIWRNDMFEVLVWGNPNDEDWMNSYQIGRFIPDEE